MSKRNKVNPGQYTQAGRLSPDDAARERRAQDAPITSERSGSGQKAVPTGISNGESAEGEQEERENEQTSSKVGSRSGAQKAAESKYVNQPHPASTKVDGAFGRESDR
jgi:hypothetical protein